LSAPIGDVMANPRLKKKDAGVGSAVPSGGRHEGLELISMSGTTNGAGDQHRRIVGRTHELAMFREAFDRMLAGRRQLVLISGEPGIGKTRCAEALAEVAEDQGALVLWGRCREEAGAPPYWPWVQILRAYVDAASLDEVRLNMGTAAKEIAALVPELLDSAHHTQQTPSGLADSTPARFRTFDAVRQFFHQATQQVPITLVLDDLHWSDAPSLSLLEFLSQELLRSRLLIVATYRDGDASRKTLLQCALGGLSRDSDVERVQLGGLSQTAIGEVAERLCDLSLSESALKMVYQQTDGNPLFAIELIKVLIDESAGAAIAMMPARIPAGVHETIGRRLTRLSERCNELLGAAAVYGRQFTARELAAVMNEDLQRILTVLEPAVQAGIVQSTDNSGCYLFTHALIRETIYEDLSACDRLRLHGRAGDALAGLHCAHLEPVLSRIAHHYHEAAALGYADQAVVFALRAAESAVRVCAYEDALLHYDHVIKTLGSSGLMHDERLARAYILKGSALKQLGQVQQCTEVLLEAVRRTRILGSAELLVDVLMSLAMISRHVAQQHIVPLLEHTLTLLPEADSAARAKALATLAFAQRTLTDKSRIQNLVDKALEMAGRSCDAAGRCACYTLAVMALRTNPDTLQRRLHLSAECNAVARSTGSAELLAEAYHWQALNHFESGHVDEIESIVEHYDSLSTAARLGMHQYQAGNHRVTLALLRGDWVDLESRIEAMLEIGKTTRRDDADGVYGAQMFALNRDLGRLHALAPQIKEIAASATRRMWEPGLMLICAEVGLLPEARAIFERLAARNCGAIRRDEMFVACLVFCAETCCALGDAARAESLYQLLRPYAGQTANHPTAVCFGAADLYLAMLACTANRPDIARGHFDQALTLNRAMRAWPSLARTLYRYGAFLVTLPADAERRQGLQYLREAEQLARRLAMERLVSDIDAILRARDGEVTFPDDLTAREVEVLRLLAIGRTNKDVSLVLAISLNTVATHVRNILNKTQCANRTEAATYAIRHGLQAQSVSANT
jgi:DNA-binding CsgD family transcriptional regulator